MEAEPMSTLNDEQFLWYLAEHMISQIPESHREPYRERLERIRDEWVGLV